MIISLNVTKMCQRFLVVLLVVQLYFPTAASTVFREESDFLLDFIKYQNSPRNVVIISHLPKGEKVLLSKIFSMHNSSLTFWEPHCALNNLYIIKHPVTFITDTYLDLASFGSPYLSEPFHWLTFHPIDRSTYLGMNSKVFMIKFIGNQLKVVAIFKYSSRDADFTENDIGTWTVEDRFVYLNNLVNIRNRTDLGFRRLDMMYASRNNLKGALSDNLKINLHSFSLLGSYLNANLTIHVDSNNTLITSHLRRNSSDVYGLIKDGQVDILGIPLNVDRKYLGSFRYLIQSFYHGTIFIYRVPALAYTKNIYVLSFPIDSWIYLLITIVIATAVLKVVIYINRSTRPASESDLSFLDIAMIQCSTVLQKSSNVELKSFSARIAVTFSYIGLMLVTMTYTACIVVNLQATSKPFKTFHDLYESGMKLGALDNPDIRNAYMRPYENFTDEALRQKLLKTQIQGRKFFMSAKEGIERVRTEFFAFDTHLSIAHSEIAKTFLETERCNLKTTPGLYHRNDFYLMVAKNSTMAKWYIISFRKITESGLYSRPFSMLASYRPKCDKVVVSNFSGTGIVETMFVFVMFISGVLLSCFILIVEILLHKYRHSWKYYQHYDKMIVFLGGVPLQEYVD